MKPPSMPSRLRRLLASGAIVAAPGASDPFTARLIAEAGFGALYLGGNALGLSLAKGQPLITLTETVDCAAKIVGVVDQPLIVDAGAGFGSPIHAHRTVLELETAGVAALHIDDQPYPKRPSYHRGNGGLAEMDEAAARLHVAVRARRDRDLMVIARTDALRVTGSLDEAIARGRAYAAAGAEALMVLDMERPDQAQAVRQALPGLPLVWIGGVTPPVPNLRELQAAGFALALYPFNTIAAIAEAVSKLWETVRASGDVPQSDALLQRMRPELSRIAGLQTYWEIEDELAGRQAIAPGSQTHG